MLKMPEIIQGGMGVGVSNWRLAQAVSRLGQLGVVSGTAIDQVLVRRLADGDQGGHLRRGFDAFPFPEMAKRIWNEYFQPGGRTGTTLYPSVPMHQKQDSRKLIELLMVSNFVEVFLAREGHMNKVGVNFLEKVQLPHLASIYGAMLAGVGYVLMGAGIPLHIPGVIDNFAAGRPAEYKLSVAGATADMDTMMRFDPQEYVEDSLPRLERPRFLAIVSSNALATTMLRRASGHVDGLIIESSTAGGHNAPPRGRLQLDERGQPVYGDRDKVDLGELRKLGVPFWMAGGYGSAGKLREALDEGAAGVQVGTAFAFSEESGLRPDLKKRLVAQAAKGEGVVFTDPLASPTGFPFKVAQLAGTYSDAGVAAARTRVCDLGYLREAYATDDGRIGYRCSAEPETAYVAKGGKLEETVGRKCLCNALLANIGHPQTRRDKVAEPPLVTVGDDLNTIAAFLKGGKDSYTAADVIASLLDQSQVGPPSEQQAPSAAIL